jgi:microcystin-dependent protein
MAFVRPRARILEISTTPGNGPYTVPGAGADLSYNSFASFMNVGDSTEGYVAEPGVAMWTGILTRSATNQITLTAVEETKGTFGAGTKEIGASPLATRAMLREDIAGAIVTGGNAVNFTVSSYRKYSTLADLDGNIIAFTPHATNTGACQLSVDGVGFRPMRAVPGVELFGGTLIQGTPYLVVYKNSDQVFYLHGLFGNPYNVPIAGGMLYFGTAAPNSAFVFPYGQAISRTVYATTFSLLSTNFGPGDGSTTFNLPDLRGRVPAGWDAMGGVPANRLTAASGYGGFGSGFGGQTQLLGTVNLPPYTPSGSVALAATAHGTAPAAQVSNLNFASGNVVWGSGGNSNIVITFDSLTGTFTGNAQGGSSVPFAIVQPSLACNFIMRVL